MPKPTVRLGVLLLFLLAACGMPAGTSPSLEASAPRLELPTLDGGQGSLEDYRGKVVVVNFWATWCAPCEAETPRLVDWSESYADRGLAILGVDTLYQDSRAAVEAFVAEKRVSYPILLDDQSDVSRQWQATQLPRSFVIDRDGVVRFIKLGELTERDFDEHIRPLLDAST